MVGVAIRLGWRRHIYHSSARFSCILFATLPPSHHRTVIICNTHPYSSWAKSIGFSLASQRQVLWATPPWSLTWWWRPLHARRMICLGREPWGLNGQLWGFGFRGGTVQRLSLVSFVAWFGLRFFSSKIIFLISNDGGETLQGLDMIACKIRTAVGGISPTLLLSQGH